MYVSERSPASPEKQRARRPTRGLLLRITTETILLGSREVALIPNRAGGASGGARPSLETVAPTVSRDATSDGIDWRIGRANFDDASGSVAVQRAGAPANDLDPTDRLEIEIVDRRLTIGKRERHAVAHDANAANTERRSRTETADRDARILSRVRSVCDGHAGHREQHLIERDVPQRGTRAVGNDTSERVRKLERWPSGVAGDRDFDRRQRGLLGWCGRLRSALGTGDCRERDGRRGTRRRDGERPAGRPD